MLSLSLLLWLPGCYTLRPIDSGAVQPPMRLVVHMGAADGGSAEPEDAQVVEGRLVRAEPERLVLSVGRFVGIAGAPGGLRSGQVQMEQVIERARVVRLEEERLSVVRTGGMLAAISVGAVFFARFLWGGAGGFLRGGSGGNDL